MTQKHVLVVEDNADLRHMFCDALKFAGFHAHEAEDGPAALRLIEMDPPDLIVLDIALPTLDGYSVREEIAAHAHTRDIPIVVVTGSVVNVERLKGICVLRKPVDPSELVACVRDAFANLGRRTKRGRDNS